MLPQRVWFLCHFGLKTDIDFVHFGLELGMVYEGTTFYRLKCLNILILLCQFQMNKKKQVICEFGMDLLPFLEARFENRYGF